MADRLLLDGCIRLTSIRTMCDGVVEHLREMYHSPSRCNLLTQFSSALPLVRREVQLPL
jgi:hypothetical protein